MSAGETTTKPFSRPIIVDSIPSDGLDVDIEANPDECAALATAIGLPALGALSGSFAIRRLSGGRLDVEGRIRARITQICVVTLEPFDSDVEQEVDVAFAPAPAPVGVDHRGDRSRRAAAARRDREAPPPPAPVQVDPEDDPPDPIVDGRIDLGVVSAEFLTLGLDFYPRKPGVAFDDVVEDANDPKPSAFAALERFKDRS